MNIPKKKCPFAYRDGNGYHPGCHRNPVGLWCTGHLPCDCYTHYFSDQYCPWHDSDSCFHQEYLEEDLE